MEVWIINRLEINASLHSFFIMKVYLLVYFEFEISFFKQILLSRSPGNKISPL
jgi:hypothetical protein